MATVTAGGLRTSTARDYLSLMKPRLVLLHLITAATAMFLASGGLAAPATMLATLLGGALVAGAASALNNYLDRDIDLVMARTRNRPLPAGRLSPRQALAFGISTGLSGLLVLGQLVSLAAAALAALALLYYLLVYTLWLKRRTRWSAVIGSGAGAFPPVIGWVAVTGRLDVTPLVLFAIIVLWTPVHFWSLAISCQGDYARAALGVIPERHATRWLAAFCPVLVAASLWLARTAGLGSLYVITAALLGLAMFGLVARAQMKAHAQAPRQLYVYSIAYLALLFGAMMADRLSMLR